MFSAPFADWIGWFYASTQEVTPAAEWSLRIAIILAFVGLVVGIVLAFREKDPVNWAILPIVGAIIGISGTVVLPFALGWFVVALLWAVGL